MKISSWPRTLSWPTYSPSVAGRRERSNCSSCGETGRAEIMRSGSMLTAALILPEPLKPVFHPDREHLDLELLGVFPLPADRPVLRQAVVHPYAAVQLGLVALAGTGGRGQAPRLLLGAQDRKSTRLNSSHSQISYAVFCLKKKKNKARNKNITTL